MVNFKKKIQKLNSDYHNAVREMVSYMKRYTIDVCDGYHEYGSLYSTMVYYWLRFCLGYSVELYTMFLEKGHGYYPVTEACYQENLPDDPEIQRLWKILQKKQKEFEESDNSLMESFNAFAPEENYISLNESLNLRPALNKIKNICARLQKEFGLDCYATEDEVTFNNDDDIMSNLVVGKKYNNLKQYLVNVIQIMKLCGRKIMFNTQYDYNSILL